LAFRAAPVYRFVYPAGGQQGKTFYVKLGGQAWTASTVIVMAGVTAKVSSIAGGRRTSCWRCATRPRLLRKALPPTPAAGAKPADGPRHRVPADAAAADDVRLERRTGAFSAPPALDLRCCMSK
jgi:hypothetical protein